MEYIILTIIVFLYIIVVLLAIWAYKKICSVVDVLNDLTNVLNDLTYVIESK